MAKAKKKEAPQPQPQVSTKVALPAGFKAKRQVTVPTLSLKEDKLGNLPAPRILRFDERMRISSYVDPDPKKAKEKPATIAIVTDMENGEVYQFLVPSVVEANLRRDYDAAVEIEGEGKNARIVTDDGEHLYVGKMFRIACLGKRPGKRYRDFGITEVEQGE